MTRIHAIRTGLVQVRQPQMESRGQRARASRAHVVRRRMVRVAAGLRLGHRA